VDNRLQTLQTQQNIDRKKDHITKGEANKTALKEKTVRVSEVLPGDLNVMPSTRGLPYRKPTPYLFTEQTQFDLQPAFEPAGIFQKKRGFRRYRDETWNFPFQPSKRSRRRSTMPEQRAQFKTHFNNTAVV
jgi:hypothetical protein